MLNRDSKKENSIIPIEVVTQRIFFIRGQKVIIDSDLADFYGVSIIRLNEQVKRNRSRFPADFMFQINKSELESLRSQIAISKIEGRGGRRYLPYAFTEHGVAMLSSVLRSPHAVQMNILIVRAFIRIREILASNKDLAGKIEELQREQKLQNKHINSIYSILEKLITEPVKPNNPIGFTRP
jgi:hypothetical protein